MIGETAVPDDTEAFLQFRSKGRFAGFGGCNRLIAEYHAADGALFIGPIGATRMRCAADLMAREARLVGALGEARTYRRQTTSLVLFDSAGQPVMELRQTDWD